MGDEVLLIGPFEGTESAKMRFLSPPLGVFRLGDFLRKNGVSVVVIDPNIESKIYLEELFRSKRFKIIGFSVLHWTVENDLALACLAGRLSPESLLIAGGHEATFSFYSLFQYSPIQAVVLGEGEYPLLNLVQGNLESPGVIWKNQMGNFPRDITGNLREFRHSLLPTGFHFQKNLSSIQFEKIMLEMDWGQIPVRRYWELVESMYARPNFLETRTIRIITSSYCPLSCTFCSSTNFQRFASGNQRALVASMSPAGVVQLMERIVLAFPEITSVFFQDDNLLLRKDRVSEICHKIREAKKKGALPSELSFLCSCRADAIDRTLLELMKDTGFRLISFGVESFSERVLKMLNKKIPVEITKNAINLVCHSGIKPFLNLILFPPGADLQDVFTTIETALEYCEKGVEVAIEPFIYPLSGSEIENEDWEIEFKTTPIPVLMAASKSEPGNSSGESIPFQKPLKILPRNPVLRRVGQAFELAYSSILEKMKKEGKRVHFPTRVRSLIGFQAFLELLLNELDLPATETIGACCPENVPATLRESAKAILVRVQKLLQVI